MWCGKISPQEESPLQAAGTEDREPLPSSCQSCQWPVQQVKVSTAEKRSAARRGVTVRIHTDTPPPTRLREGHWLSTAGASRSSEVSPPPSVTNPSGMTLLHTPPSPFFYVLRQLSEDPGPGTTTGKDGDRVDVSSHGFSHHHFTLESTALSSIRFFFFSGFRVSLLIL